MAEFREFARKLMITEKSGFLKCRDFPDDVTAFMTTPESYGPFTNTMFSALVVALTVPESRYAAVQTLFAARSTETSYKAWHLNRPEFYKILDAERKVPGSVNMVDDEDRVGYAGRSARQGNRSDRQRSNKKQSSKFGQKSVKNGKNGKSSKSDNRTVDRMCRHDTQYAGKPIYHDPPYGGGKNCKYGKNGKPKKKRAIGAVSKSSESGDRGDPDDNDDRDAESPEESDSSSDGGYDGVNVIHEGEYCPSFGGDCVGNDI